MALIIGHMGSRALAPENSLEAIRAAARCRADGVKVDVRLSKDGILVLMHIEREGERVPALREAASLARELGLEMVVEMKEEGIEELVADELKGSNALVTSFYHSSLREIKEISNLKTGIIISSLPVRPVELANWADADAIFPERTSPRLFQEAHRDEIAVYPWTINSIDEAAWQLRLGADGLVTEDPCLLRDIADQPIKDTSQSNCDYYPCHNFEDQDCTHCFCPLYPCRDNKLGRFVKTRWGKRVWTCIDCRLVHRPNVARYLFLHPDAAVSDLKALDKREDES